MSTATKAADPIENLNRKIALLEERRELLEKLMGEKKSIEEKLNRVIEGEEVEISKGVRTESKKKEGGRKPKQLVLPRGVITAASFAALAKANKPMSLQEITDEVKKSPLLGDNVPDDLPRRVRGILQTSHQFKSVGPNTFTTSSEKLRGRLFERLLQLTSQAEEQEQHS